MSNEHLSSEERSITFTRGRADLEFSIDNDGDLLVTETDFTSSRCFLLMRADLPALRDWLNKVPL